MNQTANPSETLLRTQVRKLETALRLLQADIPPTDMPVQVEALLVAVVADLRQMLGIRQWYVRRVQGGVTQVRLFDK